MATTPSRRSHSPLDTALDTFRIKQYFNVVVRARDMTAAISDWPEFMREGREAMLASLRQHALRSAA